MNCTRKMPHIAKQLPIFLLDASDVSTLQSSDIDIVDLEIDVFDELLHTQIGYRDCRATLADIIPAARLLSSNIIQAVLNDFARRRITVSCTKGCANCCSFLVPLSVPEMFCLKEDILAMPEFQRKQMVRKSTLATRRILKSPPPQMFTNEPEGHSHDKHEKLYSISNWYANLELPCPFLDESGKACGIYEQRPLACQEYFVASPADTCKHGSDRTDIVELPVSITEVLGQMASNLEGDTETEAVMAPLTLLWYQSNTNRAKRTWPAKVIVEHFVEALHRKVEERRIKRSPLSTPL